MSNQIITRHELDEPGALIDELALTAPRGWFTFHLYESFEVLQPPPKPRRRKRKGEGKGKRAPKKKSQTPIGLLQKMFGAEVDPDGRKKIVFWQSTQTHRGHDPIPPGVDSASYIWDRDDPRNFSILPVYVRELRETLPTATGFNVLWLIHPPYLVEDLRRDAEELTTPERHRGGDDERVFREYVRQAMIADPAWIPDYAQLATLFPTLAPRERPDGTPVRDRSWLLRLIMSEERKALGLRPPPAPKSARERLAELRAAGSTLVDAIATLRAEGYRVTNAYARGVWRELSRPVPAAPEEPVVEPIEEPATIPVPPDVPVEVVVEPGAGPIEIKTPPEVTITHRPAPRAEPIRIREPRPIAPDASPEAYARELLRSGATYAEVRVRLLEDRGRLVPDATLRRFATEVRKADEPRPIEEAKSRSDMARALLRSGLGYEDVEQAMVARGEKPLSRGQLRAIKANLKG